MVRNRYIKKGCCILLALACTVYIGLTLLFVDAVSHQPPAP